MSNDSINSNRANGEHNERKIADGASEASGESGESDSKLHADEIEALENSRTLLKFAAEAPRDLPRPIVEALAISWQAHRDGTWSAQTATTFWCSYNDLCRLIQPVSVDGIAANRKANRVSRWILWLGLSPRLPQRTAQQYTRYLIALLFAAVVVGFLGTYYTKLIGDLKSLSVQYDASIEQIKRTVSEIEPGGARTQADAQVLAANQRRLAAISYDFADLSLKATEILAKAKLLKYLTTLQDVPEKAPALQSPLKDSEEVYGWLEKFNAFRADVIRLQENASVYVSIAASVLLPMILGTMGACAYVVRLISEQIKDTSFTATSPIRHHVRVALGAIAGVVIGFTGVVTDAGISSPALSFIAGYAIEPVFATIDGIAEKFRR